MSAHTDSKRTATARARATEYRTARRAKYAAPALDFDRLMRELHYSPVAKGASK